VGDGVYSYAWDAEGRQKSSTLGGASIRSSAPTDEKTLASAHPYLKRRYRSLQFELPILLSVVVISECLRRGHNGPEAAASLW
jgi:hypothetical protein